MPSKNSILKRTERARTFRAEIKAKYLREQLACLRSSLYLEEQNKLLSDELLEVYHDSQELHEKIQDQNHTISLLREHEEELLQGLALLEVQNLNQRAINLQERLHYRGVVEERIFTDVDRTWWWICDLLDWAGIVAE
ncbi:15201_t:CDS:2, partial [Funneliformis geosporum]